MSAEDKKGRKFIPLKVSDFGLTEEQMKIFADGCRHLFGPGQKIDSDEQPSAEEGGRAKPSKMRKTGPK